MSKTLSLSDDLAERIDKHLQSGRYASDQDVLRDALEHLDRREQERDEKIAWLRKAMQEGLDSGNFQPLDLEVIKRAGRARLAKLTGKDLKLVGF